MYSHCLCISNKLWVHEVFKLQNCKYHLEEELQLEHICLAFVTQTAGVSADHQTPTILLQSDHCSSRFYNKHTRQTKVDTIECSGLITTIFTVMYFAKSHICSLNYINYSGLHNDQAVCKSSYDIFSISLTACSQGRRWSGTSTVGWFDPWLC